MAVSSDTFRDVLGRFATGVTIITLKNSEGFHGLTVNSFTSVSLSPPLILICIKKGATSHVCFSDTNSFVVNILSQRQQELANRFSTPELTSAVRFHDIPLKVSAEGIPILEGNLGHLECKIVTEFEGGDHTIFLAEVVTASLMEETSPLLFYGSQYAHLTEE